MGFQRWIRALANRNAMESDMAAELADHVDRYTQDLIDHGLPPAEARRRAAVEFGSIEAAKDECRDAFGLRRPDELLRNFRYACRVLRQSRSFTVTAVLTLSVCIGANTAMFSVVDAVLFRPLPYAAPDRLGAVVMSSRTADVGYENSIDGRTWELIRDNAKTFDASLYGADLVGVNLSTAGHPEYVRQQRTSAGAFALLGVSPVIGREFARNEDVPGGPAVVILSHELWTGAFAADPRVIGTRVFVRGEPHVVIGVMPAAFQITAHADLWTPLRASAAGEGDGDNYGAVIRLRPGRTWADAGAELGVIADTALKRYRNSGDPNVTLSAVPLQQTLSHRLQRPLLLLWGAVAIVLLIGCVNISSLLLARGAARRRELATRMALGSGRSAVVRQLLTESVALALLGAVGGVAVGYGAIGALSTVMREYLGVWQEVSLDVRVLAVTIAAALLTSIVFGLYPALECSRLDVRTALAEGGERSTGLRSRWARRVLVTAEVALGFTLVVGAGLLTRTFTNWTNLSPGFDPRDVLVAGVSLQDARYTTTGKISRLYADTLARIRTLPGVEAAGVGLTVPYERPLNSGYKDPVRGWVSTTVTYVTPGYFEALRIPLYAGRVITVRDNAKATPIVVVNEAFARRFTGGGNPLGRHIQLGRTACEIIGVVANVQQKPDFGFSQRPLEAMHGVYVPVEQVPDGAMAVVHTWFSPKWVVRSHYSGTVLATEMQQIFESVDPLLPIASIRPMQDVKMSALGAHRVEAVIMSLVAGLALLLAGVGVYGIVATAVAERRRELGIRVALGATGVQVVGAVVATGLALSGAGVAAGMALARTGAHLMDHFVFGTTTTDLATFAAGALVLLVIAAAASALPALRVARLNPADTLREG